MPVFSFVFFFATSALCYFDFRHFKYTTAISLSKRLWQILTGIKQQNNFQLYNYNSLFCNYNCLFCCFFSLSFALTLSLSHSVFVLQCRIVDVCLALLFAAYLFYTPRLLIGILVINCFCLASIVLFYPVPSWARSEDKNNWFFCQWHFMISFAQHAQLDEWFKCT